MSKEDSDNGPNEVCDAIEEVRDAIEGIDPSIAVTALLFNLGVKVGIEGGGSLEERLGSVDKAIPNLKKIVETAYKGKEQDE